VCESTVCNGQNSRTIFSFRLKQTLYVSEKMAQSELSDQQQIEKYLQQFQLETCLDEILNQIVVDRPKNPYVAIATAFESKTLPEILEVTFSPVYHRIGYAVRATVLTNIGPFCGVSSYPKAVSSTDALYEPKDYSVLKGKLTEALIPLDPRNQKQIDDIIFGLNDIEPAESLAVSIACCRAGAKFRGVKLYNYIAELAQAKTDELTIPLPVPLVSCKTVTNTNVVQAVQLYSIKSSSLDYSINRMFEFMHVLSQTDKVAKPVKFNAQGAVFIEAHSVEDLCKVPDLLFDR
jgi:hypothetical protein